MLVRYLGDLEAVQILLLKEHSFLGVTQPQDLTRVDRREIGLSRWHRQVLQRLEDGFSKTTSVEIERDGIHPRDNHSRTAKLFNSLPTPRPSCLGSFTRSIAEDAP